MTNGGRHIAGWALAGTLTSTLFVLASLPPLLGEELHRLLMIVFSGVCHQIPSRSPHLDGTQLAVCHRCYGIYAALAAGTLTFLLLQRWDGALNRRAPHLIALSILVPGVDWFGDVVGLWMNTPASRMLTGAAFGLTVGYFFARAMVELFGRSRSTSRIPNTAADGSK